MRRIQKALIFGFHLEENFSAYSCPSTICFVFFPLSLSLFLFSYPLPPVYPVHAWNPKTNVLFFPTHVLVSSTLHYFHSGDMLHLSPTGARRWQQMKKKSLFRFNLAVYTHITLAAFGQPNVYPSHLAFVLCPLASSFLFCKLCSSGVPKLILLVCKDSRTGKQDFETH